MAETAPPPSDATVAPPFHAPPARAPASGRAPAPAVSACPLVVDLDGTLVRCDTLGEAVFALARSWRLFPTLGLLATTGRAAFKRRVARLAPPAAALLPYNTALLAYLHAQKAAGRRLVLATASDRTVADAVAAELGLFDEVLASDGKTNLKGAAKAQALVSRFGAGGFAYAGDSRADLPVWRAAAAAVLVNVSPAIAGQVRQHVPVEYALDDRVPQLAALWRAMRPHQWTKNLLVLVPLLTAHAYGDPRAWHGAVLAFLAFCATASGLYLFNDLLDLAADRAHRRKRQRAFASGRVPVARGVALAGVLVALGAALGVAAGAWWVIGLYAATTAAYSLKLKELPLVDVFCLAAFYTLRLFGGGEASGHLVSLWLLGFSSFLFLSLALVKRVEELTAVPGAVAEAGAGPAFAPARRGYTRADAAILQMFGCAASFASCIVLALFVQSEATAQTYASPPMLWGMVPLFLFWQCRLWLSTARGYMHEDPIVYAARDWVSWSVGAALVLLLVLAHSVTWFPG
ncbi:MAG: UbiA family prenyltransferase [Rhodospirillales bacterium]|nr:UbiA family prenyltransferase [Rhodospirillales bacterium]